MAASELTESQTEQLAKAALECRERAYAPYSGFKVGAALLSDSGRVYTGCNVENASYGITLCAERNAIAAAVAGGDAKITAIAIVADTPTPCSPCGACRQFMVEFNPDMLVILLNLKGQSRKFTARELLPEYFSLKD